LQPATGEAFTLTFEHRTTVNWVDFLGAVERVFQPKYAAYLNLIEPWWKVLRSLALKGRRFKAWAETRRRSRATAYWNDHRHPFVWGRRRRHRQSRRFGIAAMPKLTLI
jgi:hypothetical protein